MRCIGPRMSGNARPKRKNDRAVPYPTEAALVRSFVGLLRSSPSPFKHVGYAREFSNGTSSRPDIIIVTQSGEVIAIEAKLTRWRDAMGQAYRNTFFADRSFVLLPPSVAARAATNASDLIAHGIGICTLIDDEITIVSDAPLTQPYNIYRRELAREEALKKRRDRR